MDIELNDFNSVLDKSNNLSDAPMFSENPFAKNAKPQTPETPEIVQQPVYEKGSVYETVQNRAQQEVGIVDKAIDVAGSVVSDIGKGMVEIPFKSTSHAALSFMQDIIDVGAMLPPTPVDFLKFDTPAGEKTGGEMTSEAGKSIKSSLEKAKPKLETNTAKLASVVMQYGVGLKAVGNIFTKGAGIAKDAAPRIAALANSKLTKEAATSLFTFDAYEDDLAGAIKDIPIPGVRQALTALSVNPDDPMLLQKAKQVTQGIITSKAIDGIAAVSKGVRSYIKATENAGSMPYEVRSKLVGFDAARDADLLGQADTKQMFKGAGDLAKKAVKEPEDFIKEIRTDINWSSLETDADIDTLLTEYATKRRAYVQGGRRGVRSWETTQAAAESLDVVKKLTERNTGQAFNAEELLAARDLYSAVKEQTLEAAARLARSGAENDAYTFEKLAHIFHAVENRFMGARAEAGRALQILRKPVGDPLMQSEQITQMMLARGGINKSRAMAQVLLDAGAKGAENFSAAVKSGLRANTVSELATLRNAMLLTSPATHIRNVASNASNAVLNGFVRTSTAMLSDSVSMGEAVNYWRGMAGSMKDGFKNMRQAFKDAASADFTGGLVKQDAFINPSPTLVRRAPTGNKAIDTIFAAQDYVAYGLAKANDTVSRRVFNTLSAPDAFFKTINFHAEKQALLYRDAISQGLKGDDAAKYIADNMAGAMANIDIQAYESALKNTFNKTPPQFAVSLQQAAAKTPALRFLMPYIRTPANIFETAYSYTPLAPIFKSVREDIAAGGAREAQALTRIGIGSVVMSSIVEGVNNGIITGQGPKDGRVRAALERAYGWKPYSIDITFGQAEKPQYVTYRGWLEPLSMVIGATADISEAMNNMPGFDIQSEQEFDTGLSNIGLFAANNLLSQTYFSGVSDFIEAMSDPQRYGPSFMSRFAGSFVPQGLGAIEKAASPDIEYARSAFDGIRAKLPYFSEGMTKQVDVWGEERKVYDLEVMSPFNRKELGRAEIFLSPFYRSKSGDSEIDKELLRLGGPLDMPNWQTTFSMMGFPGTAKINMRDYPTAYYDLLRIRGKEVILPQYGKNMFGTLNDLVSGKSAISSIYNQMNDEGRLGMIKGIESEYTRAAKEKLLEYYPDIRSEALGQLRKNTWSNFER